MDILHIMANMGNKIRIKLAGGFSMDGTLRNCSGNGVFVEIDNKYVFLEKHEISNILVL